MRQFTGQLRLIETWPPRAERPIVRLVAIPVPGRPISRYAVQKRLDDSWGWIRRLLPYWSLSTLYCDPRDACAEAYGRCIAKNDFALAEAVLALGSGFDPNAPIPE